VVLARLWLCLRAADQHPPPLPPPPLPRPPQAVATGASSFEYAATTTPFKVCQRFLRPFYPEVLTRVAEAMALAQVVDYWTPVAALAAAPAVAAHGA
jgi:hypothetical protein